jgi:hypothetical protein
MTMATRRRFEIDWAGPHGTAWGTFNAMLTTVTASWLGHLTAREWPLPTGQVVLLAVGVTVLGVLSVLLRAALRKTPTPGATVIYKLCCWTGAGGWAAVMVAEPVWSWRWWAPRAGVLVAMAVVAGLLANLATEDPPATDQPADGPPKNTAAAPSGGDPATLKRRQEIAAQWRELLDRRCAGEGYTVPNVQLWPRGNGHTVEAIVPAGLGLTWRAVAAQAQALEGDLDLPYGCGIVVTAGVSKRAALIEVTTADILARDIAYQVDRPVHSINDNLVVGVRDDGADIGPELRTNCMVLAGEARSGKSNAGHCITAEIVTTDDALQWDWHLPDGRLWAPWMQPWLKGEISVPPIDWCAWDGQELSWMTRAALRVVYARNEGYRELVLDANDDKLPVSRDIPAVVLVGDEIAKVTSAMSNFPFARDDLHSVVFEGGAAAVRCVFLALRGTDEVILNSIQSQCQVRGVMKVGGKAEAGWVFGRSGFGPEDTPYPGCGGLSVQSGRDPQRLKYFRMTPNLIYQIARSVQDRRPTLDELSRLAANGRYPDGRPMDDLMEGELDCYDSRWDRFRARFGGGVTPQSTARSSTSGQAGLGRPGGKSTAQALADLAQASAALDAAVAAANARGVAEQVPPSTEPDEPVDVDGDAWGQVLAAWDADPYDPADVPEPTGPPPADWRETMLRIIANYGTEGIRPKELLGELADEGVVISRDTLNERLLAEIREGTVYKPRYGRYARRWQ